MTFQPSKEKKKNISTSTSKKSQLNQRNKELLRMILSLVPMKKIQSLKSLLKTSWRRK
jgi:hypothetical protein